MLFIVCAKGDYESDVIPTVLTSYKYAKYKWHNYVSLHANG